MALEDETVVTYLVNENFNPEREKGINPFDKELSINWPEIDLLISEKDKSAISLQEAKEQDLLPSFDQCKQFIETL